MSVELKISDLLAPINRQPYRRLIPSPLLHYHHPFENLWGFQEHDLEQPKLHRQHRSFHRCLPVTSHRGTFAIPLASEMLALGSGLLGEV